MKVLFVEDHRDLVDTMTVIAEGLGHHASCAYDGKTAVKVAAATIFDVIVLDMALPDATGVEICYDLRKGPSRRARIVALSGRYDFERRIDLSGFDMCFLKPIGIDEFERMLHGGSTISRGQ